MTRFGSGQFCGHLAQELCAKLPHNMSREQWQTLVSVVDYIPACPTCRWRTTLDSSDDAGAPTYRASVEIRQF